MENTGFQTNSTCEYRKLEKVLHLPFLHNLVMVEQFVKFHKLLYPCTVLLVESSFQRIQSVKNLTFGVHLCVCLISSCPS